jgi:dipeptidyl aminopeptidase/acylaminoacyl peptidase
MYVLYEGEGHGFVKESSVVDSVQQELLFYGEALGFAPAL